MKIETLPITSINPAVYNPRRDLKPVALFEIPLNNHTRIDDIAVEPFAGSGSQCIACEKLDRRCFMMEIDEHYCDVIIQRWQNFTGKQAVKLNGS